MKQILFAMITLIAINAWADTDESMGFRHEDKVPKGRLIPTNPIGAKHKSQSFGFRVCVTDLYNADSGHALTRAIYSTETSVVIPKHTVLVASDPEKQGTHPSWTSEKALKKELIKLISTPTNEITLVGSGNTAIKDRTLLMDEIDDQGAVIKPTGSSSCVEVRLADTDREANQRVLAKMWNIEQSEIAVPNGAKSAPMHSPDKIQ